MAIACQVSGLYGVGLSAGTTHWRVAEVYGVDDGVNGSYIVVDGPVCSGKSLAGCFVTPVVDAPMPKPYATPYRAAKPHPRAKLIAAMAGVKAR